MALLIADAGPLFSLAAGDLLPVLERFSLAVTDIVKEETFDKGLQRDCSVEAERLAAFHIRHAGHIQMIRTQVGAQLATQRKLDPHYQRPRNLGELSIQSYLIELHVKRPTVAPIVLFEDAWFIRNASSLPASSVLMSTQAFLLNLEKAGIIQSAARARQAIETGRPDASLVVVEREWGRR